MAVQPPSSSQTPSFSDHFYIENRNTRRFVFVLSGLTAAGAALAAAFSTASLNHNEWSFFPDTGSSIIYQVAFKGILIVVSLLSAFYAYAVMNAKKPDPSQPTPSPSVPGQLPQQHQVQQPSAVPAHLHQQRQDQPPSAPAHLPQQPQVRSPQLGSPSLAPTPALLPQQGVRDRPNPMPVGQIPAQQALRIKTFVQSNSDTRMSPLDFKLNSIEYKAWFTVIPTQSPGKPLEIINIQKKEAYGLGPQNESDKIGIGIDEEGGIISIRKNGTSVQEIPDEWMACLQYLSPPEALGKEDLCTFRAALKELQKRESEFQNWPIIRTLQLANNRSIEIKQLSADSGKIAILPGRVALVIQVEGADYFVWFTEEFVNGQQQRTEVNAIVIESSTSYQQKKEEKTDKIGIRIAQDGKILSVLLNDGIATAKSRHKTEIPKRFNGRVLHCFTEALKMSSKYALLGSRVDITLVQRGLTAIPIFHLNQLSEVLETVKQGLNPWGVSAPMQPIRTFVQFLENNLRRSAGVDAGGLSRGYLTSLFGGLLADKSLQFSRFQGLAVPKVDPDNDQSKLVFEKWGKILMLCYFSDPSFLLSTGVYLHRSVLQAALSLTSKEINEDTMSNETMSKLFKILNELENDSLKKEYQEMFDLILLPNWDSSNIMKAKDYYESVTFDELPDGAQPREIKAALLRACLPAYKHVLAAHSLARGMKSFCHLGDVDQFWNNNFCTQDRVFIQQFSDKTQGKMDRLALVNAFRISSTNVSRVITQKVDWLKRWIRDEKTKEEVLRNVILYLTGMAGVPDGQMITFEAGTRRTPIPFPHTCAFRIELYPQFITDEPLPDNTYENFVKVLEAVAQDSSKFSAA